MDSQLQQLNLAYKEENKDSRENSISAHGLTASSDTYGPFSGQIISSIKDIYKRAFMNAEPRVVEGFYICDLQATQDTYGKIYTAIDKCRGKVISEELQEGTNNFLMQCLVPLIEGFVFTEEIFKKGCGIAYPQLVFHGWEVNPNDPFFIPKTEEEKEDLGEGDILPPNPTKVLIEKVRVRKGIPIEKALEEGDKDRKSVV